MDHEQAMEFANHWIESWNAHDLDEILSHYSEDFEMSSPLIRERMGIESGIIKGKGKVREYWEIGLRNNPQLKFNLKNVLVGSESVVINYLGHKGVSSECFFFNDSGKVTRAIAHYAQNSSNK